MAAGQHTVEWVFHDLVILTCSLFDMCTPNSNHHSLSLSVHVTVYESVSRLSWHVTLKPSTLALAYSCSVKGGRGRCGSTAAAMAAEAVARRECSTRLPLEAHNAMLTCHCLPAGGEFVESVHGCEVSDAVRVCTDHSRCLHSQSHQKRLRESAPLFSQSV